MCVCTLLGGTLYVCLYIARGNIVCVCTLLGGTLYVCLYIARGDIVCVFVHC